MEEVKAPAPDAGKDSGEKKVNSVLLYICTTLIAISVNFLWNLKGDFAALMERDKQRGAAIDGMQSTINRVQSDIQELKERMARLEAIKAKK